MDASKPVAQDSPGYTVSSDPARIDAKAAHAFLSRSYWAQSIPYETVERALSNSLCIGAFHEGTQVGLARLVTDRATFAYLADVYVLEEHRGRGVSKMMMQAMRDHPELQGLRRMLLATRDAHGLYAQFGFKPLMAPDRMMEINQPDIYTRGGRASAG
ncbi:GNAT family N-acetyltransferase [Caenimonas sp. DR4.4]|uniref:GNAT family N-acetyltransferase n=2 Tax=Caenimonas aquaedulcis TaxID=2793270 RepID=A0A931H344_9BURK|nr:GNAT family N-acetyltransferase [Caenimonas aquaedulcis]